MSISELDIKVTELRELQSMIAELQAEAEAIKDVIKTKMIDEEVEELNGNGWRATWKNVNTRRFDNKRFKAEHPELAEQYTKTSATVRFTLV